MSGSLHINEDSLQYEIYGNEFVIISGSSTIPLTKIGLAILNSQYGFIEEVIATEKEILLKINERFDPGDLKSLADLKLMSNEKKREIKLPVHFHETEDWQKVTAQSGLAREEYIQRIVDTPLTVGMFGFLPGFVYINGLDPDLHIPRKKVPSKYVHKNAVAIGEKYIGIYSLPSPGGWSVIGTMAVDVLDTDNIPPTLLQLDDQITIESITSTQWEELQNTNQNLLSYNGLT